ncbi:Zinc carboxypeptidase [Elizabethkingia miricola]|nr:Zinc carboxypeptidase [Elizabethkingia miricola]
MKLKFLLLSCFSGLVFGQNTFQTPYEKGNGNQSVTYDEMNTFYKDLSKNFKNIQYLQKGEDDNGKPIYVVIFNPFKEKIEKLGKDKTILMINNGIHPGEPDGIDATMMLMRDLATQKVKAPKNIVIAAIAAYNVSGMLNRSSYSRANQNGPEEYGFRGNARNYDLNRDFIKADTKNARSFQQIYQWLNPDVFIDNHVSNGADYQYTFTYISTHKERLGKLLGDYFFNEFQADNLKQMQALGYESTPYVNIHGDVPEIGFASFEDSPRYATGYTSLFNSIGTVVETHMLKPYDKRVDATYKYMLINLENIDKNYKKIKELRKENLKQYTAGKQYPIRWKVDSTKYSTMDFKGFEAGYKPSGISGQKRLYYDRNKPFTKKIKLFNTYAPTGFVSIPRYYVIPQSEYRVIEELKRNHIRMNVLKRDSVATVETYKINDFKTVKNPYEGHYTHYETVVGKSNKQIKFLAGDYVVPTQQAGVKYILETLEPEALDSFFNWNFFDAMLGQKEYYSAYIFEDTAAELMKNDLALRTAFEAKKKIDKDFAKDGKAQLDWVYENSPYYEKKTHRQYPIYRIL